jgi:hypothetical protein
MVPQALFDGDSELPGGVLRAGLLPRARAAAGSMPAGDHILGGTTAGSPASAAGELVSELRRSGVRLPLTNLENSVGDVCHGVPCFRGHVGRLLTNHHRDWPQKHATPDAGY